MRATEDIDLLIARDLTNQTLVKRALEILPDRAIRELGDEDIAQWVVVRVNDDITIDLMTEACGLRYEDAAGGIETEEIEGVRIPFAGSRLAHFFSSLAAARESGNVRIMSMTVDQIVSEARQLPQDLRAELLDRLGGAMHGDAAPEVAAEWNQLALDRLAAIESGRSQLRPGEEVMARMRQLIGR